jgi:protoheme IX farnesyltransferase
LADYLDLTKPRIAVMSLFTVAVGFLLGSAPTFAFELFFHTLLGTALVAAGAGAMNHYLERHTDSRMHRTRNRPLPSGRLSTFEVFIFGQVLAFAGIVYLMLLVPNRSAMFMAAMTFFIYIGIYTPLKQMTSLNTLVGAIPGALPPLIGWCAARGVLTPEALSLFLILFVWQLPHFLAIAWMYREDYARGGYRMLSVGDTTGRLTTRTTLVTAILLLIVGTGPFIVGVTGWVYLVGSTLLGLWFIGRSIGFCLDRSDAQARRVLKASLVYLTLVMALLIGDGVIPKFF